VLSVLLFVIPVAVALLTRSWDPGLAPSWALIAVLWGGFTMWFQVNMERADRDLLALHASLADADALRRLIEWDLRWFRYPVVVALAFGILALLASIYVALQSFVGWVPVPPGTLALGLALFWLFGETSGALALLIAEYPMLARQRYRLYLPNPAASYSIQRSLRGHGRFAALSSVYLTATILATAFLLASAPALILPVTACLLVLAYGVVAVLVIAPRVVMTAIVRGAKEGEVPRLQAEIAELWTSAERLDDAEYERFTRLKARHDELVGAPSDLLNVTGIVGKIIGAVLLPTVVGVLATLANRLMP